MDDRAWRMFIAGILFIILGIGSWMYLIFQPANNPFAFGTAYPPQYIPLALIVTGLVMIAFDYWYLKKSEDNLHSNGRQTRDSRMSEDGQSEGM
jgi:uncharacterized membrane-anchored protein